MKEEANNPHPRGCWSKSTVIHKKETRKSEVKSTKYNNTWLIKKVKEREYHLKTEALMERPFYYNHPTLSFMQYKCFRMKNMCVMKVYDTLLYYTSTSSTGMSSKQLC